MLTRPIPSTGEAMPVIGLGTWRAFDVGKDETTRRPLREVVQLLLDAGGRMIDSSPMYGRAEAVAGDILAELAASPRAFLATKVWTTGRERGIEQMRRSAQLLRSDVIDLMQIHNLVDWRTHLASLRRMKDDGHIRYIGITHYTTGALPELARILAREPGIDFVQLGYSLATRAAETEVLPVAASHGIAVIANQPLERGDLFRRVRGRPLPDWTGELYCELGATVPQICPCRACRYLRDPGDRQCRTHGGQPRRRVRQIARSAAAAADSRVVGRGLAGTQRLY